MSYDAGDSAIPASGTWGTCAWEIDADGVLTVHPGVGTDANSSTHPSWYSYRQSIASVKIVSEDGEKVVAPKYCYYLFSSYSSLKSADLSGLDTSNVSYMRSMFEDCSALVSLDNVKNWNTSNVVDMETMFSGCSSLTSLDLGLPPKMSQGEEPPETHLRSQHHCESGAFPSVSSVVDLGRGVICSRIGADGRLVMA